MPAPDQAPRTFLVVVDQTAEMPVALYYASRRAIRTGGRVALLAVQPPPARHGLRAVEELMREENRQEAEQLLLRLARDVNELTGTRPIFHVREGDPREELMALVASDPTISIVVLAAGIEAEGPGPLVTYLVRNAARLSIPFTIVPGGLGRAEIDLVT